MIDYHLHTPFCRHASGPMDDYARRALELGLEEICFTPHVPLPGFPRGGRNLRMEPDDLERYLAEVESLRPRFPRLTILTGLEADYYPGYEEYLARLLEGRPFDLVLLSVHFVAQWPVPNWLFHFDFPGKPLRQVYREYLAALKEGILTGLYDGVAHLDIVKRPGQGLLVSNRDEVLEVLELCGRRGMSVEINTSGWRRPVSEPYPAWEIVELAAERKLPLLTGSDAHAPQQVAHGFSELRRRLARLPEARLARYRRRRLYESP